MGADDRGGVYIDQASCMREWGPSLPISRGEQEHA